MDDYHIHTAITDGKATPIEIIKTANSLNIKTIAFTEHISKKSTYDWFDFRKNIYSLEHGSVNVLVGVETKVLNEFGELNVTDDILDCADIVLGACHGNGDVEWLLESDCDIIAHPQITQENVEKFVNCGKILEINFKHQLPWEILDKLILDTNNIFSLGSDTHTLEDFFKAQEYFIHLLEKYPKINLI